MRRILATVSALALAACFSMRSSDGGGQTRLTSAITPTGGDVVLPPGYRIEPMAAGLSFPSAIAFGDDDDRPYVVEAGYSYGEAFGTPRVVRIEPGKPPVPIASGDNPPWTGLAVHGGKLYLAEGGVVGGGRIVELDGRGQRRVLVEGLPSLGDHHTNGPVIGPDGMLYFGQGTATNAGIVGIDNRDMGWLARRPDFHDVPCRDIVLTGVNVDAMNPLVPNATASTGAFVPFGTKTEKGQRLEGRVPCSGAIMRVPLAGGAPELVAWGLRNPFGLVFGPGGELFVTDNQYDVRGSRPVFGAGDVLWKIDPKAPAAFHGWPDFAGNRSLADERFAPPGRPGPQLLLEGTPRPPAPVAYFPVHASADGIDISRSARFGHAGEAFVAEFGDLAPAVGKTLSPVGFKVVRVDLASGVVRDFATNRGKQNGPASKLGSGGLERPVSVRFDRRGTSLWVVDFGIVHVKDGKQVPRPGTGRVWRIRREDAR